MNKLYDKTKFVAQHQSNDRNTSNDRVVFKRNFLFFLFSPEQFGFEVVRAGLRSEARGGGRGRVCGNPAETLGIKSKEYFTKLHLKPFVKKRVYPLKWTSEIICEFLANKKKWSCTLKTSVWPGGLGSLKAYSCPQTWSPGR